MNKLDRLGWTAGLSFVSHGSRVGIRTNEPALLDRLSIILPAGSVSSASPIVEDLYSLLAYSNGPHSKIRRYNILYAGSVQIARTLNLDQIFEVLEEHVHLAVAIQAPRRLFIRASVIGWGDSAIVVTGDDARQIASVVDGLSLEDSTHYSNRYAVFDRRGRIHAYPTAPANARPGDNGHSAAPRPPRLLLDRTRRRPLRLGWIALVGQSAESFASVRELSPAQAVLVLLSRAPVSRLRPAFAMATLRESVAGAVALDLRGENSHDIVAQLMQRLTR